MRTQILNKVVATFVAASFYLSAFIFLSANCNAQFNPTDLIKKKEGNSTQSGFKEDFLKKQLENELAKMLGANAPLKLDQSSSLEIYKGVVNDFLPSELKSKSDLNRPLAPGDYKVDVIFYCTQYSMHRPSKGLPYKLSRADGRLSKQICALLFRGTNKKISPNTLNIMAWRIQAGVTLGQWPLSDQQLVKEIIPEYVQDLKGDFLQQIEDKYNKFAKPFLKKEFDVQVSELGAIGKPVMQLKASRKLLADNLLASDNLPERLYQQTSDGTPLQMPPGNESPSPWIVIQPNLIARFTVLTGNLGHNLLEFRVLENNSEKRKNNSEKEEVTLNHLINGTGENEGNSLLGYSIGKPAQAPIIEPYLEDGWYDILPPCPCTYQEAQALQGKITTNPIGFWNDCGVASQEYHYGASFEVRWLPQNSIKLTVNPDPKHIPKEVWDQIPDNKQNIKSGQQCTYNDKGELITSGIAAGSPDLISPGSCGSLMPSTLAHYCSDVLPWGDLSYQLTCTGGKSNLIPCYQYLLGWPANQGDGCEQDINEVTGISNIRKMIGEMTCQEATILIRAATESVPPNIDKDLRNYIRNAPTKKMTYNEIASELQNWQDNILCKETNNAELCRILDIAMANLYKK